MRYFRPEIPPTTPPVPPTTPVDGPTPTNPDILLPDWSIVVAAHHNCRVIADLVGLTYAQKEVLVACIFIESGFDINAIHINYAYNSEGVRYVSSTDYSLVQVNDYWHIGAGKDFPSVEYVIVHPQEQVEWMANYYKANGNLNLWDSYLNGSYKAHLGKV